MMMTADDKIGDEKLQFNIIRLSKYHPTNTSK